MVLWRMNCTSSKNGMEYQSVQFCSTSSEWIINYLSEVFIDIDQSGNLRKEDEAEACFKLFFISYVFEDYKADIILIFK